MDETGAIGLSPSRLGVAVGIVCAIYIAFVIFFADKFPMNAKFIEEIYGWLGYNNFKVLGIGYGFIDGFLGGWLVGWIYNRL